MPRGRRESRLSDSRVCIGCPICGDGVSAVRLKWMGCRSVAMDRLASWLDVQSAVREATSRAPFVQQLWLG